MESHRAKFVEDKRCLFFLLNLWWRAKTGKSQFYEERQVVPFSQDDWSYLRQLIEDLLSKPDVLGNLRLQYLKGLALFHLGQISASFDAFRDIERQADKVRTRRRIVRSYLASTPEGKPKKFHGIMQWKDAERNRGEIYVEELRRRILFFPRDFALIDSQKGDAVEDFHIAFNFIGPAADPAHRYVPDKGNRDGK